MQIFSRTLAVCLYACAVGLTAQADEPDWIAHSNGYAQMVLSVIGEFSPESAAAIGVDGLDREIVDLGPSLYERRRSANRKLLDRLQAALGTEADSRVRQDIRILVRSVEDDMASAALRRGHLLPYFNVTQTVFRGIRALIDPQVAAERHPAALERLEKYTGLADGYEPLADLAIDRTRERFDVDGLAGPYRGEIEQDLERADALIDGIRELFDGTEIEGWQPVYETIAAQLRDYNDWLRAEMLARARDDFRQPAVLYADALRNWGVYSAPEDLIAEATRAYMDIRNEMTALAPLVADKMGYETSDFREVIALLKRDGAIDGDELLEHYYGVLEALEDIIERHGLVSLPARDAGIRIATAAETAVQPAAHLDVPRLIGNRGEYPYFVIPKLERYGDGSWQQTDDTYEAGSWTLTAHEARPGHELQFSSIIEGGVSTARAIFAFNSANVEGWGLYAEAIVRPYLPLEAQLVSLQYRLIRAGRMFLDPMLNLGLITTANAKALMIDDMAIGEDWADNEIERYTYRIPGQATAYYYGYSKMQSLRARTEIELGDAFDQRAFHDFVLAQGLLPPDILADAVMTEFVPRMLD